MEGYPTWRRSYPEDPKIDYLRRVEQLIAWRDQHAPGKEIRVTEFGWDASTKPAPATGTFSKWVGSTETEQAQYLVRSFLLFSKLDVTQSVYLLLRRQGRTAGSRLFGAHAQRPAQTGLPRGRPPASKRWATTGSGASSRRNRETSSSTSSSMVMTPIAGSGPCGRQPERESVDAST